MGCRRTPYRKKRIDTPLRKLQEELGILCDDGVPQGGWLSVSESGSPDSCNCSNLQARCRKGSLTADERSGGDARGGRGVGDVVVETGQTATTVMTGQTGAVVAMTVRCAREQ